MHSSTEAHTDWSPHREHSETSGGIVIRGFFYGAVVEDSGIGAHGQLHLLRSMGVLPLQNHLGRFGDLTIDDTGHWQYMLHDLESHLLGLADEQAETETFLIDVTTPDNQRVKHMLKLKLCGTEDIPDIIGIDLEPVTQAKKARVQSTNQDGTKGKADTAVVSEGTDIESKVNAPSKDNPSSTSQELASNPILEMIQDYLTT